MAPIPDRRTPWETNFRNQMKRRRELLDITQTELARDLKNRHGLAFHQQTVQRIEAGDRPVRLDEAFLIAEMLGASVDDMVLPTDEELGDVPFQVDLLRRSAQAMDGDLTEIMNDWSEESFMPFAAEFLELWDRHEHRPTRAVRWAAAWVIKAIWMYDFLDEAVTYAGGIHDRLGEWRENEFIPHPAITELRWLLDGGDIWNEVPETDRPLYLADLNSQDLYAYMRDDDVEHPETP